jgi:hypothetical protein
MMKAGSRLIDVEAIVSCEEGMSVDGVVLLGAAVCALIVCGGMGAYIAEQKGRPHLKGVVFGVLLGPLGMIIEACLPTVRSLRSERRPLRERKSIEDMAASHGVEFLERLAREHPPKRG